MILSGNKTFIEQRACKQLKQQLITYMVRNREVNILHLATNAKVCFGNESYVRTGFTLVDGTCGPVSKVEWRTSPTFESFFGVGGAWGSVHCLFE